MVATELSCTLQCEVEISLTKNDIFNLSKLNFLHGKVENPERKKAVNCNIGHAYPSVSHSVLDHEDDIVLILG